MKIFKFPTLLFALLLSTYFPANSYAEKNAATAARQAQIDADQAAAKAQDLAEDAAGNAAVDGVDSVDLAADEAKIAVTERDEVRALRREAQAEAEEQD